ncbi:LemA family protein [Candidatus Thorarchaeota archaeon]|nr:MAG: LemA family protein [Candidatus Thorarchaeota archaeon]
MEGKQIVCIVVLGLVIVGVGVAVSSITTYNGLVAAKLEAENDWTHIQIQFERKIELIPQLVEIVENYTEYEQETLTAITELRTQWLNLNGSPSDQANISSQLNVEFNTLFVAIQENYPTLYADVLYQELFDEITGTENRITQAKLDYNDAVTAYNTALMQFPGNIWGGMFGLTPMQLYAGA